MKLVGSSKISTGACRKKARARAMRCYSPPLRSVPSANQFTELITEGTTVNVEADAVLFANHGVFAEVVAEAIFVLSERAMLGGVIYPYC